MTPIWREGFWKLRVASFVAMGGALALGGGLSPIAFFGNCAHAQVTPDGTLGAESSVVTPTNVNGLPGEQIGGGATRGANLFHSFEQFSIPTGSEAFFNNALDIQNIISRVTGLSVSNIDGLLRANGTASLFLLNPNGIVFGPNASLNIGGSFVGSTASSLNFADGTQFSANAPQTTTPLLTVSVPIGLQYGGTTGSILNQSQATNSSGEVVGLSVLPGETLALLGGDVRLDGGNLQALGGRVELGGLAGAGTVGLSVDSNNLLVSFSDSVAQADVSLSNGAEVDVAAGGGGSIAVNTQNLNLVDESILLAGIASGLDSVASVAGDVQINATGVINLDAESLIVNAVLPGVVGKGGNINVTTGSLSATNGAALVSSTFGQGNAGNVNITARDTVSFDGVSSNGFSSGAFSSVAPGGVGYGGSINLTAGSLSVTDGAQVSASTFGQGNAGDLNVLTVESVELIGTSPDGQFSSGLRSAVEAGAVGDGGDLTFETGRLLVRDGAQVSAATFGQGNAGSVNIKASDTVSFDGVSSNGCL